MYAKLMKGQEHQIFTCTHVHATPIPADCIAVKSGLDTPGIRIELSPKGPTLRLPEDGDALYVMNEAGDTIDTFRWPEKRAGGAR